MFFSSSIIFQHIPTNEPKEREIYIDQSQEKDIDQFDDEYSEYESSNMAKETEANDEEQKQENQNEELIDENSEHGSSNEHKEVESNEDYQSHENQKEELNTENTEYD